ncbi:MAG: di/tripeptidase [Myxococcota bacterium]|jgi:di/tripeptidase
MQTPKQTLETIAQWGLTHLEQVIAIDSQSDEKSPTIPSTEGQRHLAAHLATFFEGLGYHAEQDDSANLIVTVPANVEDVPAIALMVHTDTAEGTIAVPSLQRIPAWDGSQIDYPANERLAVSAENYPATRDFLGEDVLHGPGDAPVGLDDKLGMAELMTLARILRDNPTIAHGEVALVFRPDEEIGRMEAVVGLAAALHERGISYGYTVDGIAGFEINTENFNASAARVVVPFEPVGTAGNATRISLRIDGVKSHGATAKAEGYLNAVLIFALAAPDLPADVLPIGFESDPLCETSADACFLLTGDAAEGEAALLAALNQQLESAAWRGAELTVTARGDAGQVRGDGGLLTAAKHIRTFLQTPGPTPVLSEDSDGHEGYSNPHFIVRSDDGWAVDYRLRDFDRAKLDAREEQVRQASSAGGLVAEVTQQYVNMGASLAEHPQLVTWALDALKPLDVPPRTYPIRGGTGVDPFLAKGIPVANLGTGYFAPESEKELTSSQSIGRHSIWLTNLVQVIASKGS